MLGETYNRTWSLVFLSAQMSFISSRVVLD
jgi:hypothetical protein